MSPTHRSVLLATLVVLSTLGAGVAVGQSAGVVVGSPDIDVYASPTEFDAGTEGELRLSLTNDANIQQGGPNEYENRVVTARGVRVDVRDGKVPFDVSGDPVGVGDVGRGTTPVDALDITVPEGTDPGTYRIPVEVSYRYTVAVEYDTSSPPEYQDLTRQETQYVTVRVREQSRFEVVDVDTTAQVGDRGSLSVTVANVGSRTARDATLSLTSSSDEITFGSGSASSTGEVGTWTPGTNETLNYTVAVRSDAALRSYSLSATVDYRDPDGIARTSESMTVGLRPAREQSFALRNVSATLRVGEDGTFSGTVVNRGPDVARQPVVLFRSSNPNVNVESNEYALETLAPDESGDFAFDLSVSESAGASTQQFNVTVRYRNERGDLRASDALQERVVVDPRRDRFGVAAVDGTVVAGQPTTLQLRVTNRGDEPLRNVEAKAFVQSPLSSDDDEAIVSTLDPGETTTITVGLAAGGSALEKAYPVSVDFQYELPDGDTQVSRTYRVPVTVEQRADGGPPVVPIAVAGVVLLVAGLALYRWRNGGD
jgi:hypothetical protein